MKHTFHSSLHFSLVLLSIFFNALLFGHGLGGETSVTTSEKHREPIEQIHRLINERDLNIPSFDACHKRHTKEKVVAAAKGTTNCIIKFWFDNASQPDIICTPSQLFYLPKTGQWIPAVALRESDQLFSRPCGPISITQRELAYGMHTVYSITVEKTNTFFAGRFGILVHNMILPLALSGTISLPFGAVGGIFGGFFGMPTFALSAGLAGLLGLGISKMWGNASSYHINFGTRATELQFFNGTPSGQGTPTRGGPGGGGPPDPPDNESKNSAPQKPPKSPAIKERNAALAKQSKRELERGKRSLEKQITKHRQKLDAYRMNPDAYDNKGFLKGARSQQERDAIIQTRMRGLEKEITNFSSEIEKINTELRGKS